MIAGGYEGGAAFVWGWVWCDGMSRRLRVRFLVDTGIDVSRVSVIDIGFGVDEDLPLDDRIAVQVPGREVAGVERACIFGFDTEGEALSTVNVVAYLADVPAGESRLGRDVINQWLMVYNAPGESLLFEPLDV